MEEKYYNWLHTGSTIVLAIITLADIINANLSVLPPDWQTLIAPYLHGAVGIGFIVKIWISQLGAKTTAIVK